LKRSNSTCPRRLYVGDDQLDALRSIKSKEEMVGEIIWIVTIIPQPRNVISGLKSGVVNLPESLRTLSEKILNLYALKQLYFKNFIERIE